MNLFMKEEYARVRLFLDYDGFQTEEYYNLHFPKTFFLFVLPLSVYVAYKVVMWARVFIVHHDASYFELYYNDRLMLKN